MGGILRGAALFISMASNASDYVLVKLRNGDYSVRSVIDEETFHPGIGPAAEAEALYVLQLRLPERVAAARGEFVVWDVGLGAAANALSAVALISDHMKRAETVPAAVLRIISFDRTLKAVEFAAAHPAELSYVSGFEENLRALAAGGSTVIHRGALTVQWDCVLGDFPSRLAEFRGNLPSPQAVLFDPHSPSRNPAMWTVSVFQNLLHCVDSLRPCSLANFTRSTMARVAMLLGGWFVGVGHASGMKEETTVAASSLELLDEPLNFRWLERARRSDSAEPLWRPEFRRAPLSPETWEQLRRHPQFQTESSQKSAV